jgi:hypothetical protein
MVITGLANDIAGDLQVTDFKHGSTVDDSARDGFTLTEFIPKKDQIMGQNNGPETSANTAQKTGWLDDDDVAITQALMDATAIGGLFGPGSEIMSRIEFSALISRFFSSWALSTMVFQLSHTMNAEYNNRTNDRTSEDSKAIERRMIERLIIEQALIQDMQIDRSIELYT